MEDKAETAVTANKSFTWTIENFSSIKTTKKKHYSDVFVDGSGFKWRMLIFPKGNNVDHNLSMYLYVADAANFPEGWSRYAKFTLSVVNQKNPENSLTREAEHHFNVKGSGCGFTSFMLLSVLYNPSKGFLVNDTLIFETEVILSMDSTKEAGYSELTHLGAKIDGSVCSNSSVEGETGEQSLYAEVKKEKVFDEMPQLPHYAPLDKYGDIVRKGMMIGLDIAFSSLSKEIENLEEPQSFWFKLDDYLKQLTELEEMGYKVEKLREQLRDIAFVNLCKEIQNLEDPQSFWSEQVGFTEKLLKLEVMGHNVNKLWEQVKALETIATRDRRARFAVENFEVEMKEHEKRIAELRAEIDTLKKDSLDAHKEFSSTAKSIQK